LEATSFSNAADAFGAEFEDLAHEPVDAFLGLLCGIRLSGEIPGDLDELVFANFLGGKINEGCVNPVQERV
jgi:hypothetical protein